MSEYRDIKSIAADVRLNLKREFPRCVFSVSIERYSMGQSMTVKLMKAPFDPFAADPESGFFNRGHAQLNEYTLRDKYAAEERKSNGVYLTEEGWNTMKRVDEIMNAENWDNSDSMTDYYDVNYAVHLGIGKWNKPFEVIGKVEEVTA